MQPILLCIAMEPGDLMRISFSVMGLGIRVKDVKQAEYGQTLGALCGLEPESKHPAKARVGERMLVMAGFDDALLDRLLKALRDSGQTVRLKAVLTPHNRHWTCGQLYLQLSQEAAAMGR